MNKFLNVAVVVQCRLSSTRLPQKALMDLGGCPTILWTLSSMKKVLAKRYFLACDYDSEEQLSPIAKKAGWEVFAGSRDDVLGRFCSLIKTRFPECDLVVRATGDNPFLFYEAANFSVGEFEKKYFDADYFTLTGLPHGSGVELFKASSILKAESLTTSLYDHEHVGPSLYNHPENFKSVFVPAPKEFYFPDFRTTIDTFADYKRAQNIVEKVSGKKREEPYSAKEILFALKDDFVKKAILFVPTVKAGQGTGHLHRALELCKAHPFFVYVPKDSTLKEAEPLVFAALNAGLKCHQVVHTLLPGWDMVFLDLFKSTKEEMEALKKIGPVCSIDDGSKSSSEADFLLDVIPSIRTGRLSNAFEPGLIGLPKNVRPEKPKSVKKALVTISGESRDDACVLISAALSECGVDVTLLSSCPEDARKKVLALFPEVQKRITVSGPVGGLKERLFLYDAVFTHYGFTAFEAVAANVPVVLFATSGLHKRLSKKYGFVCLSKNQVTKENILRLLKQPENLESRYFKGLLKKNEGLYGWETAIKRLSFGKRLLCPVCKKETSKKTAFRTNERTFSVCAQCGITFISFTTQKEILYNEDYFGTEYKRQYGRTYLDDFDSIKAQGSRRLTHIMPLLKKARKKSPSLKQNILDIGCAYGPFLSAAGDFGLEPFGTDISEGAVLYVKDTLGFKAARAFFADFNSQKEFGVQKFNAVTMWYVIEHCQDLKALLTGINGLLPVGGVFAFSTPSGSGLSEKSDRASFFRNSPSDHYSVWCPKTARRVLKTFGFKVKKIVPTGIHPERGRFFKRHNFSKGSFIFFIAALLCKWFKLGDTFEVYCQKIFDVERGM